MRRSTNVQLLAFCLALLAVRVACTREMTFVFLTWNLFLAWLPVYFAGAAENATRLFSKNMFLALSILFLPNAPYLFTDLLHLNNRNNWPKWFDLMLLLGFAFFGLSLFLHALYRLVGLCVKRFRVGRKAARSALLLATGYGVYLGRYARFNSWQAVTEPVLLLRGIVQSVLDQKNCLQTLGVSLSVSVFLYLIDRLFPFHVKPHHELPE